MGANERNARTDHAQRLLQQIIQEEQALVGLCRDDLSHLGVPEVLDHRVEALFGGQEELRKFTTGWQS